MAFLPQTSTLSQSSIFTPPLLTFMELQFLSVWWPGKSQARCRLLLGGGQGQPGNSPQDFSGSAQPKQPEDAKTARRSQSRAGLSLSWALEASEEQWEAANTNFLKVNTYKLHFGVIFPKLLRGNGCPVPINFNGTILSRVGVFQPITGGDTRFGIAELWSPAGSTEANAAPVFWLENWMWKMHGECGCAYHKEWV